MQWLIEHLDDPRIDITHKRIKYYNVALTVPQEAHRKLPKLAADQL
jgi:hypothetical protein